MSTREQQITGWINDSESNRSKLNKEIKNLKEIKKTGKIHEKKIGSVLKIAVFVTVPDLLK